jgi:hypothetical protein
VVYNCCGSSPAQLFSGPSPVGLMTTFYCLRFETLPTWKASSPYLCPPVTEWRSYTPRHWVSFSSPSTTGRAMVVVFDPASKRDDSLSLLPLAGLRRRYSTSPLKGMTLSLTTHALRNWGINPPRLYKVCLSLSYPSQGFGGFFRPSLLQG